MSQSNSMTPAAHQGPQTMEHAAVKGRSLWDDARRRLLANRAATISMGLLLALVLLAIFGPFLTPFTYDQINKNDVWACLLYTSDAADE